LKAWSKNLSRMENKSKADFLLPWLLRGKKKLAMIEDYFKVMEVAMIWVKIEEDRETIMIKFLNDLNREIANIIKLQHYIELKDMVYMATNVERQLNKKDNSKPSQNFSLFSSW